MSSWVKVSRKLLTSAIAAKPEYLAIWVHLLLSASYKPGEVLVGHQVVKLEAGQLVFGRIKFAQQIGVSEHTLRMALKALESLQQITIKSYSKFSVISVVNWEKYQGDSPANHQQATSKPPASHHNKEVLEIQEENSCDQQAESRDPQARIPYDEILDSFQARLPGFPQPRRPLADDRRKAVRMIWTQEEKFGSVDFFDRYFKYVSESEFLGSFKGCGFDWLMKKANFRKVCEGNYHGGSNA